MSRAKREAITPLVREWEGQWETGWTSILPLRAGAGRYPALYLAYYSGDGSAQVGTFRAGRKRPFTPLFDARLSQPGWGRFATWLVDGVPHVLGYAMNHGNVGVERIDVDARRADPCWKSGWSSSWTAVDGFELDGRPYLLSYRPVDGVATIDRVSRDGRKPMPAWETGDEPWPTGFTTVRPVRAGGRPYLFFYRNRDGFAALARVRRGGLGVLQTWDNLGAPWQRGWFGFVPFETGAESWLVRYRLTDGALELDHLGRGGDRVATVWAGRSPGWGHVTRMEDRGAQYLVGYHRDTGALTVDRFDVVAE